MAVYLTSECCKLHHSDADLSTKNLPSDTMLMTTKKTTRITVSFSEKEYAALEAIARQQDASMSWVVRRAVSDYLEHHPVLQEEMLLIPDKLKKAQ